MAFIGLLSLGVIPAGAAGAQTAEQYAPQTGQTGPAAALEERVKSKDAALREEIEEISAVGADLEESQARVRGAQARSVDLREQSQALDRELEERRRALQAAKVVYEQKARAAYKGGELRGLASLLNGLLGSDGASGLDASLVAEVLFGGRESLEAYADSKQGLSNTSRQISQKQRDYADAVAKERTRAEELRRREAALDASIGRIRADKARAEARLQELEPAEKARVQRTKPATGGGPGTRGYELRVAREGIVARPVGPLPKKAYTKLYKEAAREYGFGEDWYVLAAVGRVESDHGANMGPSSAGAMGPMQFLPSTWETSGVDGNGDGVANVMDPEDAIPAAAGYLRVGGAPKDWYRALYSYNHADWYVKKVLGVAEGYRRLAGDNRVGPYV